MATKGVVDTKIDTVALNEIIVAGNVYKTAVCEQAEKIITICRKMEEEESLKGGDGDNIRECFSKIGSGCLNISKSAAQIAKTLDQKLAKAIQMKSGAMSGGATESMTSASKKAGVLKKE